MKKALQKIFSLFKIAGLPRNGKARKTRAQSLVEVAIAFPVLIMLLSGMVEFGFMLNYYLSLLDATRDAARHWSNADPFNEDGTDNPDFYKFTAEEVRDVLDPSFRDPDFNGRKIVLDPAEDDVIVSVYGVDDDTIIPYPDSGPYHLYNNGKYPSNFTEVSILNARVADAPNAGMLVVEIHYNYHQVLALPWMTPFNPLVLVAHTIMPIRAAEPINTP